MIDLYFWPTGNNKKVVILLEDLQLPYTIKLINIGRGDQFASDFLKISPNNRVPAIVDHQPLGDGAPIAMFESGAIMMYLAEKAGRFWPQTPREKYNVVKWVVWQLGNQGPKMGEYGAFSQASKDPANGQLAWGVARFGNEVNRLFGVLELGLFGRRYLANDQYSIADMICYPWASLWESRGIDIADFPHVRAWLKELGQRVSVQKAMSLTAALYEDPATIPDDEKSRRAAVVSNQRWRGVPADWLTGPN